MCRPWDFRTLAVIILLTVMPLFSKAQTCEDLFGARLQNAKGRLKVDFEHDREYSKELPQVRRILNQCQMNTCHIYSWLAGLELRAERPIELSEHYLVARLVFDRAMEAIEDPALESEINLGASVDQSRELFVNYGLVPDSAWKGSRDFKVGANARQLTDDLKAMIEHARASNESKAETAQKLTDYFKREIGEFPRWFSFEGKRYTPRAFSRTFFPVLEKRLNLINVSFNRFDHLKDGTKRRSVVREYTVRPDTTVFETSIEHIERVAREAIDAGQPVYVAYETNLDYIIEKKPSIWSLKAWDHQATRTRASRAQRLKTDSILGSHSVQIVGYDIDPKTMRVVKWKMKNSWGETAVDDGYFHMYDDYFRAYVLGIAVFSDPRIRLPKMGEP